MTINQHDVSWEVNQSKFGGGKSGILNAYVNATFEDISDFAKARNSLIMTAEAPHKEPHEDIVYDWGLCIDSDEEAIISSNLKNWLDLISEPCGFLVTIKSKFKIYQTDKVVDTTTAMLRLFKLHQGYRFRHRIHENIGDDIIEKGGQVYTIPRSLLYITHSGYNMPDNEIEQKCKRNINILKQMIEDKEDVGFAWYHLGRTYFRLNRNEQGDTCWRMALASGELRERYLSEVILYLKQIDYEAEYIRLSAQDIQPEVPLS